MSTTTINWHPCGLLSGTPTHPYALVVLNQPVNAAALDAVIDAAAVLVCADAGADRLYRYDQEDMEGLEDQEESRELNGTTTSEVGLDLDPSSRDAAAAAVEQQHQHQQQGKDKTKKKKIGSRTRRHNRGRRAPDAIVGDLDSLTHDVEAHYRARGVEVVKDPDQYSTDFTKCLKWIRNWVARQKQEQEHDTHLDVVVLGGLGGRVDQGFSQIHHLFMAENDVELLRGRIYLLSEQSLSFVLANGQNAIHVEPGYFEENVGIIPVLGRALLTTKGLEWDVQDWPTEFGHQVSTSNHIRSSKIEIAFQGPQPLFTMELDKRLTARGE